MNITKEQIKETIKELMSEDSGYKAFFKKALEKAGKSIPSMSDEEKKSFFNKIDAAWDAKGEKNEGNAFGAAVTKAKEDGKDEFEVDGKKYKVKESKGCNCGCGGCSTSLSAVSELVSTLSEELAVEVATFIDRPIIEGVLTNKKTTKDVVGVLVSEGITNVLTDSVKSEFDTLIQQYK